MMFVKLMLVMWMQTGRVESYPGPVKRDQRSTTETNLSLIKRQICVSCCLGYRLGTVNSKSFVSKVLLQIKWKFELTVHFKHEMLGK